MDGRITDIENEIKLTKEFVIEEAKLLSDLVIGTTLFCLACYFYSWFRWIPCAIIIIVGVFIIVEEFKADVTGNLRRIQYLTKDRDDLIVRSVMEE